MDSILDVKLSKSEQAIVSKLQVVLKARAFKQVGGALDINYFQRFIWYIRF